MSFVYEEEKLPVTIKGQTYEMRAPSAQEQDDMGKAFKAAEGNSDVSAISIYVDFFEKLGVPKTATMSMSMKGLVDLFGYSIGSKKN